MITDHIYQITDTTLFLFRPSIISLICSARMFYYSVIVAYSNAAQQIHWLAVPDSLTI
ncbi:hypothetical protein BDW62DRAFT_189097, partial [Aspergillus aurantiobrunneus]